MSLENSLTVEGVNDILSLESGSHRKRSELVAPPALINRLGGSDSFKGRPAYA